MRKNGHSLLDIVDIVRRSPPSSIAENRKMADEEKQIEDELVDYEEEDENAAEAKGEDSEATQIKK